MYRDLYLSKYYTKLIDLAIFFSFVVCTIVENHTMYSTNGSLLLVCFLHDVHVCLLAFAAIYVDLKSPLVL